MNSYPRASAVHAGDRATRGDRALVIIPAYNEAESLPLVLVGLKASDVDLDILVVDDGSTDETAAIARAAGAVVLRLPFNTGIGGALRAGFRYAVERGYERAVQFDADGQHDPGAVTQLLAALDEADLVVGSRFSKEAAYTVGATRAQAMLVLRVLIRILTGRRFSDPSSGFRAFSRPVLVHFSKKYSSEYMESVEALVSAVYAGYRVKELPVRMFPREKGQPSTVRLRLAYHYIRVVVTILTHAHRRPRATVAVRS